MKRKRVGQMNRIKLIPLILLIISSFGNRYDAGMKLFILGQWSGEFTEETNHSGRPVRLDLEFLPFNTLLISFYYPDEQIHGERFSYHFITDNQIMIQGRIRSVIQISKDKQGFIIVNSDNSFLPNGAYKSAIFGGCWSAFYLLVLMGISYFTTHHIRAKRVRGK